MGVDSSKHSPYSSIPKPYAPDQVKALTPIDDPEKSVPFVKETLSSLRKARPFFSSSVLLSSLELSDTKGYEP